MFKTFSSSRYASNPSAARRSSHVAPDSADPKLMTAAQPEQRLRLRSRPLTLGPVRCSESRTEGQRLPYRRPRLRGYAPQLVMRNTFTNAN